MTPNIGKIDRIIRIVVGLVILGFGVAYQSAWGALGFLPLFTAFFRFCPAYRLLGISTCKIEPPGPPSGS
jgi:hypothetical protein